MCICVEIFEISLFVCGVRVSMWLILFLDGNILMFLKVVGYLYIGELNKILVEVFWLFYFGLLIFFNFGCSGVVYLLLFGIVFIFKNVFDEFCCEL